MTAALAERGQLLPFEPPHFAGKGTFGGAIASGLAGPARPWRGSVRDAVLGVEIVNGLGERLRFGGSVMKNVAGYDISRLMAGAQGTLGVILSASVRVLPAPEVEETWYTSCGAAEASALTREWARLPLPITATCWLDGTLSVRLSASASAVASARRAMGLREAGDPDLWAQVRDHRHAFFTTAKTVRRVSLPRGNRSRRPASAHRVGWLPWGGCQAWLADASNGREQASHVHDEDLPEGAFVTAFDGRFAPLAGDEATAKYARRLKSAFDPECLFNPGLAPLASDSPAPIQERR